MNISDIIDGLHPYERKAIMAMKDATGFNDILAKSGLKDIQLMRAIQWLQNKNLVIVKEEIKELIAPDSNGKIYLKAGLPEKRFLLAIKGGPANISALKSKINLSSQEIEVCIGLLRKKLAINIKKKAKGLEFEITDNGREILERGSLEEQFLKRLPIESSGMGREDRFCFDELKKRQKIIKTKLVKTRTVFLTDDGKEIAGYDLMQENIEALTPELIKSGSWQFKKFRRYDVKASVPRVFYGRRHFTNEALDYIKRIWLDMGFKEMQGRLVQQSFWNFDALFTPQDHPAREMQDTFFLGNPDKAKLPDKALVEKVSSAHENGWTTGSKGWRYHWNPEEAKKLVLRTHTTALSSRTIASLNPESLPARYFAVGRCFRNETQDWSHLFEFYQVEGIVIDPNANFKNLIGYLKLFYKKMGYDEIRIRPGYFPYTEMSAEIDVYDKSRGKWIELGGAGMFRPEVVKPLLGKDVPVLAWGLGLARIIVK
ncbi:MAG: phenylalanine--tRNA ligase subunit alpha [Candidatus Woesearchaeota archaeon]|nr:phenylalanine--tRNA ligase subunit alpha [Candidatus Woesearchaeota archaeon]